MATVTENKGQTTRQSSKPGKKSTSGKNVLQVPEALIYEMDNGVPIYYRGYKEVLAGTKQPEEIMGSSIIQSRIVKILQRFLDANLPDDRFEWLAHEIGVQMGKKDWRACDIAIVRTWTITSKKPINYLPSASKRSSGFTPANPARSWLPPLTLIGASPTGPPKSNSCPASPSASPTW